MAREKLERAAIDGALKELDGWTLDVGGKSISRKFEFHNFSEAFAFMTRSALAAEKLDHHPDWSNSWNKVTIDIVSHDKGGITDTCIALAEAVNRAAG